MVCVCVCAFNLSPDLQTSRFHIRFKIQISGFSWKTKEFGNTGIIFFQVNNSPDLRTPKFPFSSFQFCAFQFFQFCTVPLHHLTHSLTCLALNSIWVKSLVIKMLPTCSSLQITKWESTLGSLIWISLPTSCVVHGPAASTWSGSLWTMQASQALPQAFWIRITILRFPRWFLHKLQFEKPWVTTSFEEVTFRTFPFIIIPGSNLQTRNVLPVSVFLLKLNP